MKEFEVSVEVRLNAPLTMDGDLPPAVGYIRHYEVAASSPEEAEELVTVDVVADGAEVVAFADLRIIRRRSSVSAPSVTSRSGRAYFPEESA